MNPRALNGEITSRTQEDRISLYLFRCARVVLDVDTRIAYEIIEILLFEGTHLTLKGICQAPQDVGNEHCSQR